MSNSKHKSASFPTIVGGSSLLVIFAVLCLTIFTLLALSTAQANARLLSASTQAVAAYYSADLKAEQIYAQLRTSADTSASLPAQVTQTGNHYTYSCPISPTQELQVIVVRDPSNPESWSVLRWQAISTVEYEP